MIQLHKWYPFVHPSPYDARAIAHEKRAEKLEYEYKLALEATKIEKAVDALGDQGRRVSIAMFFAGALCTVTMDRKSDLQNWLTSVG